MFRIVAYCEDKQLAAVLHALAGKVRHVETPVPVVNAETDKTGKPKAATNGRMTHMFIEYLRKHRIAAVTAKTAADWLEQQGMSRLSYSYLLRHTIAAGALRKEKGKEYHVLPLALPKPKKGAK